MAVVINSALFTMNCFMATY